MLLRAEYSVGKNLQFLANLDMMHLMERSLRRAGIPCHLTEGFNPHIKLSMGTVLPVGLWGENEYFDLDLEEMDQEAFKSGLNAVLPPDMRIKRCQAIPANAASIMKAVNAACYVFILKPGQDLQAMIDKLLSQEELLVQSRGKNKKLQKNLRPGIYSMKLEKMDDVDQLTVMVSINEPVNIRFDELLALFADNELKNEEIVDFFRQGNYIKEDRKFYSPMEKV